MSLRGDFGAFAQAIKRVASLGSAGFRGSLNEALGKEALQQIRSGFDRQCDPYGRPWAPSKKSGGKTLVRSGRLRASFTASVDSQGIVMHSDAPYAGVLHSGNPERNLPARGLAPVTSRGLGVRWRKALFGMVGAVLRRTLKR